MKISNAVLLVVAAMAQTSMAQVPGWATEFLNLVNNARSQAGVQPLCLNKELMEASVKQSQFLENAPFSHDGPGGNTVMERVQNEGLQPGAVAENIAGAGIQSARAAFDGLINSPGHRKNILNPEYNLMGIGGVDLGEVHRGVWVQTFAGKSDGACIDESASIRADFMAPIPEPEPQPEQANAYVKPMPRPMPKPIPRPVKPGYRQPDECDYIKIDESITFIGNPEEPIPDMGTYGGCQNNQPMNGYPVPGRGMPRPIRPRNKCGSYQKPVMQCRNRPNLYPTGPSGQPQNPSGASGTPMGQGSTPNYGSSNPMGANPSPASGFPEGPYPNQPPVTNDYGNPGAAPPVTEATGPGPKNDGPTY